MEVPGLANDGNSRRLGCHQRFHARIVLNSNPASASHAEGANLALTHWQGSNFLKEHRVLFVGKRITALDHVNSDLG